MSVLPQSDGGSGWTCAVDRARYNIGVHQGRHLRRAGGPEEKEKKKEKKEKKKKEKEKRELWITSNYTTYKVLFFYQFFNSPVALKNKKNSTPQEKVEMTPLASTWTWTLYL